MDNKWTLREISEACTGELKNISLQGRVYTAQEIINEVLREEHKNVD